MAYAVWAMREDFAYQYAFDLYHPWGIREARAGMAPPVNPYADTPRVGRYVFDRAGESTSLRLQAASGFWKVRNPGVRFEPTGTPLFYTLLALLPHDYDVAHATMTVVLFAALAGGICLLGRLRGWRVLPCLCLAAFAWSTFNPFTEDVRFANVSSLQFLGLAAFIVAAQSRAFDRWRALDLAYLPLLALFVLVKPNTGLVSLVLAAHYAMGAGLRRTAIGAALSVAALAAGVLGAIAYFGEPRIWLDWYEYIHGRNGGTLLYSVSVGNFSLVKMLDGLNPSGIGITGFSALVGALLVALTLVVVSRRGRDPARIGPALRPLLSDPWLAASAAILFTFAVSPLVWPHYWVLLLVPMLRLFRWHGRWDRASACIVVSYLMMSPLLETMRGPEGMPLVFTVMLFSWMPLIPALLSELASGSPGASSSPFRFSDRRLQGAAKP
jgi:hypothetical protein